MHLREIAPTLGQQGFEVVPLRWIVERTFSWLGWFRRLTLDYERYPKTAETMVYIASIYLMRNRIKRLFNQALNSDSTQLCTFVGWATPTISCRVRPAVKRPGSDRDRTPTVILPALESASGATGACFYSAELQPSNQRYDLLNP